MQAFTLTIICCVVVTLALAVYSGRNIKNAEEYITGGITFSPLMLCLTIVATLVASGYFSLIKTTFHLGVGTIISHIFILIILLSIGRFIATKMVFFKDCYTPGDIMHKLYGKEGRMLGSFAMLGFSMMMLTNQLRAIKYLNTYLLGMSPTTLYLLVGVSVVLYTVIGGARGVIKTDALQFGMVFLALFIITRVLINKIGGFESLFKRLPAEKADFLARPLWQKAKVVLFWNVAYILNLPIIMRVLLIPSNKEQVKKTFYYTSGFFILICTMLTLIGLGAIVYFQDMSLEFARYPAGSPEYFSNSILGYLTNQLFSHSKLIQAFLFLGMLFALASTFDSYMHAAGIEGFITFSHLSKSFEPLKRLEKSNRNSVKALPYIRLITLLMGALVLIFVITKIDLFFRFPGDTVVIANLVLLPLIAGILGLKTDKKSLFVFSISYTLTFILCYFSGWYSSASNPFWIAMSVASPLYFITHYSVNKGFVMVKRRQQTVHYHHRKPSWQGFLDTLKAVLTTPSKLANIAQENVKVHGHNPLIFTIFIIGFWILTSYDSTKDVMQIVSFYTLLQGIGLVLCVLTMALSWAKDKPHYSLLWFVTVGYCIPYATTLTYLTDIKNSAGIYSLLIAFIILLVCVNWQAFFTLSFLGISGALMTYRLLSGQFLPAMEFQTAWRLILAFVSISIAAFFFSRKAEQHSLTRLQVTKLLGGGVSHEIKNYLQIGSIVGNFITLAIKEKRIQPLNNIPEKVTKKGYFMNQDTLESLEIMGKELIENSKKANDTVRLFKQAMKDKRLIDQFRETDVSIKQLVQETMQDDYFKQKNVAASIQLDLKDDFMKPIHQNALQYILITIVKRAIDDSKATKVQIVLNKSTDSLHIRDNGEAIPSEKLPYIFDLFQNGRNSSDVGIGLVKHLVESFGGTIQCTSHQGESPYTIFTITFA